MTRRPPPKRRLPANKDRPKPFTKLEVDTSREVKAKANIQSTVEIKRNKKTVYKKTEDYLETVVVPLGDGRIGVTHGKKYWCSSHCDGLTIESTCHVSLSCKQTQNSLEDANEQASKLAWAFMRHNFRRVEKDLDTYLKADPKSCSK